MTVAKAIEELQALSSPGAILVITSDNFEHNYATVPATRLSKIQKGKIKKEKFKDEFDSESNGYKIDVICEDKNGEIEFVQFSS
jgi:hypothetical protein